MKDENSVPTAQKMTDVSLSIFRSKFKKTRIQMIDYRIRRVRANDGYFGPKAWSDHLSASVFRPLEIPQARWFSRRAHTLSQETSCRPQVRNRDSEQKVARCQIRGCAAGAQCRIGTD